MLDIVRDYIKDLLARLPKIIVLAALSSGVSIYVAYKFFEEKDATFGQTVLLRQFQLYGAASLIFIWTVAFLLLFVTYLIRRHRRPPLDLLHVAVANFSANSDVAAEEGRGLRTLIRHEIGRRAAISAQMKLVGGIEAPIISDAVAGAEYGRSLSAHIVVGGDAIALGRMIKFKPLICIATPYGNENNEISEPNSFSVKIHAPQYMLLAEASANNIADLLAGISGVGCFQRREFEKSIAAFESIDEKTSDVWSYLAAAFMRSVPPKFADAQHAARRAITLNPRDGAALVIDGVILIFKAIEGEASLDEAEAPLKRAAEIRETIVPATANLATIAAMRGQTNEAIELYLRAAKQDPTRPGHLVNAASALIGNNRSKEAETLARQAVDVDPRLPVARNLLGRALFEQKRYQEAFDQYRLATQLDDTYSIGFNSLGEVAHHLKKPHEALAAFTRAIEINPKYAHAFNNRGFVLSELGRFDEAEADLKKATELDTNYADPWSNLASLYRKTKRTSELQDALTKTKQLQHLRSTSGTYPVFRIVSE